MVFAFFNKTIYLVIYWLSSSRPFKTLPFLNHKKCSYFNWLLPPNLLFPSTLFPSRNGKDNVILSLPYSQKINKTLWDWLWLILYDIIKYFLKVWTFREQFLVIYDFYVLVFVGNICISGYSKQLSFIPNMIKV